MAFVYMYNNMYTGRYKNLMHIIYPIYCKFPLSTIRYINIKYFTVFRTFNTIWIFVPNKKKQPCLQVNILYFFLYFCLLKKLCVHKHMVLCYFVFFFSIFLFLKRLINVKKEKILTLMKLLCDFTVVMIIEDVDDYLIELIRIQISIFNICSHITFHHSS